MIELRISLAWLPLIGSSLVVRAAYGICADAGVYVANSGEEWQRLFQMPVEREGEAALPGGGTAGNSSQRGSGATGLLAIEEPEQRGLVGAYAFRREFRTQMAGHEGFGDQRAHGIAVRAADDGRLEIVAGGRGGGRLRKEAQKGGRLAADAAARDDASGERGAAQRVDDGNACRRRRRPRVQMRWARVR